MKFIKVGTESNFYLVNLNSIATIKEPNVAGSNNKTGVTVQFIGDAEEYFLEGKSLKELTDMLISPQD